MSNKENYKCQVNDCKNEYNIYSSYKNHMIRRHPDEWKEINQEKKKETKFICKFNECLKNFASKQKLGEHI